MSKRETAAAKEVQRQKLELDPKYIIKLTGTLLGISVLGESFQPMAIMTAPPGGFIALGLLLAIVNTLTSRKKAA